MARSSASDTRYLELKNGKWRVTVSVPRSLQAKLGTRIKRPLNTDSLTIANQLKWQVVAELKAEIDAASPEGNGSLAAPAKGTSLHQLRKEALEMAALRQRAAVPEELELLDYAIALRAEEIRGEPMTVEVDEDAREEVPIFDPIRYQRGAEFGAIARGEAIPLDAYHEQYMASIHVKARTRADDERSVKYLREWCEKERVPATLQAFSRRTAVRFMDGFPEIAEGKSAVTLQKYLNRLSRYWQWLVKREYVEVNVWSGLKYEVKQAAHDEQERPFTEEEIKRLLKGNASRAMHDLIRIGALTGARLDVIVDLKVKDCSEGLFVFKPQKKESKPRAVPIHPDLQEIVRSRTDGKGPEEDVFPEWPAPKKEGSVRERSFKASNAFTEYRREVGVEEMIPGKRRSLVNFHSFRRWFITMAERADQPEHIIAAVVGHKRGGITLGRYSAGPLLKQARRCVEAVKLPS